MRVRVRCAVSTCGHRFTVSGGIRNSAAEADRRRAFFESLIALIPLVGIVRARDRAIETSQIHLTTASRHVAKGVIGAKLRRYRGAADHYYMVEQVMRVYGLARRKQSDFPNPKPMRSNPPLKKVEPGLVWLLLSRARGIAALVLGLPRPTFGEAAPSGFPSWIDRGARGVDPQRAFYPRSRHACAAETVERLHGSVVAETPDGYWASPAARDWLRTRLLPPTALLTHTERGRLRAAGVLPDEEWWGPSLEMLEEEPPPVPDPSLVLGLLKRDILHARHLAAAALMEDVDEGLRYWVETTKSGTVLRVRVTLGGRTVGRAEAELEKRFRIADNAAELRLDAEDRNAKAVKLVVGRERLTLPGRSTGGPDHELAKRLISPSAPADMAGRLGAPR